MRSRLELHNELLQFVPSAYFQPPSNIKLSYPCIIYSNSRKDNRRGNDSIYLSFQEYKLILIEHDPDSTVSDSVERHFENCAITQYYTVDNLNHTSFKLYF